ncbi:cation diffusion facilitator family transporter [Peptoniphilus obesi]|uniref:cation diffusion facilitator family transporter n=1 Tax=Peptoniphilus obesi TaxID=1472765 RepID=UPI0004B6720C|nr:cation diffusion facilitator family transporter [Peptoniphilus obesi]
MIANFILEKGKYNTDKEDRLLISSYTSIYGLILNLLLVLFKGFLFLTTSSVSILADAINNLVDSVSSIVTLVGAKLSHIPPDKEHPYGHGRIEYISALIVSAFIFITGFQFIKVSVDRIINPVHIEFNLLSIMVMTFSIIVKLYMTFFFDNIGKKISAMPLRAQSRDYLSDVFVTSVVVVSMIVYRFTGWHIDGYVGIIVSIFIIYSGYDLIRETFSELIGEVPVDMMKNIEDDILKHDKILGVHDMMIVNFGPDKDYLTLDVEIPYNLSLVQAHNIIDEIEKEIGGKYNVDISIHVDPVGYYSEDEKIVVNKLKELVKVDKRIISFHDIYIENGTIFADIVINNDKIGKRESIEVIREKVGNILEKELNKKSKITIDRYFY